MKSEEIKNINDLEEYIKDFDLTEKSKENFDNADIIFVPDTSEDEYTWCIDFLNAGINKLGDVNSWTMNEDKRVKMGFSEQQIIDLGLIFIKEIAIPVIVALIIKAFPSDKNSTVKVKIKSDDGEFEYQGPLTEIEASKEGIIIKDNVK
ncbi:hypothetical protein MBBAR_1c02300 [Methanobrevibacter arboriphilus JCM 13429 = DSM 1125]|uniref:Uncharacterized protein n=1 Tax=Methanobrevibacter arboriphilus JCM 13429 = DSM 1125 TaxID=1300164 RepID=A0A1V6N5C9_METAZ|nr:hypothetical protein [Methanobrevibacter arboriphilus]OQD59822.1 hypothetical protein MBBAR_1c02300 [Methanobrevibacter arboriphilus JCM 13429 = DSM 1125]